MTVYQVFKLIRACFIYAVAILLLIACDRGGDGVPEVESDFVETEDPNRFLEFVNMQQGLPAGNYTVVAGTENPGASGGFTITATRDDGETERFAGSWPDSGSGGTDERSPANPAFEYAMPYSGGVTFEIESGANTCLYLLDPGGSVMAGKANGSPCSNPETIELPASKINHEPNAAAYYETIDPESTRLTLADWAEANGFGQACDQGVPEPCEVHVIFRDTKDLGYGRDMYARRNGDGSFAVYVRNFRVDAVAGQQYTTLNLDAAVANSMDPGRHDSIRWHFGSNAIEFSTYPYGAGEPRDGEIAAFETNDGEAPLFTKYFTFVPDDVTDPDSVERRINTVDLDGRGGKSMPGPCIACHGGQSRPLLPDGTYPAPIPGGVPGDTQAQMQVVEIGTIEFSDVPGWQCEDVIEGIHFINQGVLSTYETVREQYAGVQGYWQPDFAAELLKGWYNDAGATDPDDYTLNPAPGDPDYDASQACDYLTGNFYDYVPTGWQPDPDTDSPPAGADDLFREVIAPNCMVCHSRRGVNLGTDQSIGVRQDIDFSSYERFASYAGQIEAFVFHKGVMPIGLLNFDAFWDNSEPGRAELLASHIPGFSSYNVDGSLQKPGRPRAVIAVPRNTNVPVTLSAEGSSFAETYGWLIVEAPDGAGATLSGMNSRRAVLDTDTDGDYVIRLSVQDDTRSDEREVNITVDSSLPVPADIRFGTEILTVMENDCQTCHSADTPGAIDGVPLYYTESQPPQRELYSEVMARVNFKEPLYSPLLRKPSGHHHFGSCRDGFDLTATTGDCGGTNGDRSNYDLFLNWILQGAPR